MEPDSKGLNIIVEDSRYCTPCKTKDKHVDSQYYCTDCEAYYCEECFDLHPRVPYLAKHTVLKHDEIDIWSNLQYKCTTHNKKFEFFCGDHKELCCHVCVSLKHRLCVGMEYIQESARNIGTNEEIRALIANIDTELERIQSYETKFEAKVETNKRSKSDYVEKLQEYMDRLRQKVDLLQEKALRDMTETFEANEKYSKKMSKDLQKYSTELNDIKRQLTIDTKEKDVLVFISWKRGDAIAADIGQTLSKMDITTDKDNFKPVFDEDGPCYFGNLENIASIEDETARHAFASCEDYYEEGKNSPKRKDKCKSKSEDLKQGSKKNRRSKRSALVKLSIDDFMDQFSD